MWTRFFLAPAAAVTILSASPDPLAVAVAAENAGGVRPVCDGD